MPNKAQPREVEGLEELFNSAGISSTKALRQGQKACAKLRCKSVTELCELASAVERQTFVAHVRRALSRSEEKALEEQLNQLVPTDEQIRSAVVSAASMFGTLWSAFRGKEKSTVSMLGDSSSEEEGIGSSEDGDAEEAELAARDTAAEEPTVPPPRVSRLRCPAQARAGAGASGPDATFLLGNRFDVRARCAVPASHPLRRALSTDPAHTKFTNPCCLQAPAQPTTYLATR